MNSERKAFIDALKKLDYFNYATKRWDEANNRFEHDGVQTHWELWCASAQRQGYKLVPVDVLERAISHISIAMCHHNNTRNEENIMHNDMVIIEKAMIGAVDE